MEMKGTNTVSGNSSGCPYQFVSMQSASQHLAGFFLQSVNAIREGKKQDNRWDYREESVFKEWSKIKGICFSRAKGVDRKRLRKVR
jgi:hypothetical protein